MFLSLIEEPEPQLHSDRPSNLPEEAEEEEKDHWRGAGMIKTLAFRVQLK